MRALKPLSLSWRRGAWRRGAWRESLGPLVYGLMVVLTLAGIAHLLLVLLMPRYAVRDAATLLIGLGADGRAELVSSGDDSPVRDADPNTELAACGFDLEDGPLRVRAATGPVPLSLSIHLRGGGVLFAVTDRAAQRGILEFVVLTRQQFEERLRRDADDDSPRELRIVSPRAQGIVLARALVPSASDRPTARALVTGVACGTAD